jgi:hypothetical protein
MNPIPCLEFRRLLSVGALLSLAIVSRAQSEAPPPDQAAQITRLTTAHAPVSGNRTPPGAGRTISNRFSEAIAASLPKYDPQASARASAARDESAARRDDDKSTSNLLRLPDYVVHDRRPPVLRERDLLTERGLSELAQRRYISTLDHVLNDHSLPLVCATPEARALAEYAEDERLTSMEGFARNARDISAIDRAAGADLKRLADETFMRRSDVGVEVSTR